MAKLIDIYDRYQDITSYPAVVGFTRHVYVKLTHGGGLAPSPGTTFVRNLKAHGARVGGYHYALPSPTPERQADVLAAEVRRLGATGLPPALDLEEPGTTYPAFGKRFLNRLRSHGFNQVTLYANASTMRALNPQAWGIPGLVVWCASYSKPPSAYYSGKVHIHQYTDTGRIPGIPGTVDINNILDPSFLEDDDVPYQQWPKADKDALARDLWSWNTGNRWGKDTDGTPWNEAAFVTLSAMETRIFGHLQNHKREILGAVAGILTTVQERSGLSADELSQIVRDALADEVEITGNVQIANRADDPADPVA